jgi:hypothetical protein
LYEPCVEHQSRASAKWVLATSTLQRSHEGYYGGRNVYLPCGSIS